MYRVKFATSNLGKLKEITEILSGFDIEVETIKAKKLELQCEDLAEIAEFSALDLAKRLGVAVAVEDSGLHVSALNNFPGPYSKYVYEALGLKGILKLLESVDDRTAYFKAVVAYAKPEGYVQCFDGVVLGTISHMSRGLEGFGFDPIFIPKKGDGRTFAEMSLKEKNLYSHRSIALNSFGRWILSIIAER